MQRGRSIWAGVPQAHGYAAEKAAPQTRSPVLNLVTSCGVVMVTTDHSWLVADERGEANLIIMFVLRKQ